MKNTITVFILLVSAVAMPAATKKKTAATTTTAPAAVTIPKDAVPNADGNTYLYTDKQGKKWVYAKTPFGIIRNAYSDPAASESVPGAVPTKAIDKGDTVRFERPGPFGTISWEKKKADLTDDERRVLGATGTTAGAPTAGSSVDATSAKAQ